MRTIWKYIFKVTDEFHIEMPVGAEILSVDTQENQPCMWVLIPNSDALKEIRTFRIYGTGNPIDLSPHRLKFIGTFPTNQEQLWWHLFERTM